MVVDSECEGRPNLYQISDRDFENKHRNKFFQTLDEERNRQKSIFENKWKRDLHVGSYISKDARTEGRNVFIGPKGSPYTLTPSGFKNYITRTSRPNVINPN